MWKLKCLHSIKVQVLRLLWVLGCTDICFKILRCLFNYLKMHNFDLLHIDILE